MMATLTEAEREQFTANLRQNLGYAISPVIAETLCGHVEHILTARETALREEIAAAIDLALYNADLIDMNGAPVNDYALGGQHAAQIARQARP